VFRESPLLRSGLALAGAQTWLDGGALPGEAEDGLLTAEDVAGMDLLDTQLVVLSACDTGLGEVRTGEGVLGLRRAFAVAGARALVVSLWKVPDGQTQELMVDFYARVLAGEGVADALRQARLAVRGRHPDSYFWGAFVCQGDPGPLAGLQEFAGGG
jgi:CHAT domain-containing protein